jgi:hypothetical protein
LGELQKQLYCLYHKNPPPTPSAKRDSNSFAGP